MHKNHGASRKSLKLYQEPRIILFGMHKPEVSNILQLLYTINTTTGRNLRTQPGVKRKQILQALQHIDPGNTAVGFYKYFG